jgi:hypothetical protein
MAIDAHQFLGLSKLHKGDGIACSVTFPFIYHLAPLEDFHSTTNEGYRPDIAIRILAAGIAKLVNKGLSAEERRCIRLNHLA